MDRYHNISTIFDFKIFSYVVAILILICSNHTAHAINAAPSADAIPPQLMTLTDDSVMSRGNAYARTNHPDSALMCYMLVLQRSGESTSREAIIRSLKARLSAGSLYYDDFYDYGKAYSLFYDTYEIASEHKMYDLMSNAANNIGNVLSVYNSVNYSPEREVEIIGWYKRSVELMIKYGQPHRALPTVHNLISMALDTVHLRKIVPTLKKYRDMTFTDSLPGHYQTMQRLSAYLDIADGKYGEAASSLRSMLYDSQMPQNDIVKWKIGFGFDLAGLFMLTHQADSALKYVGIVEDIAKDCHMYEILPGVTLMKADIYGEIGDDVSRNKYLLEYYRAKDSLTNISTISLFSEPHLKKKINDIDVQLVKAIDEKRIRNVIIVFGLILLVVAGGFTTVLVKKNKMLTNKNRNLLEKMETIERQDKLIIRNTINSLKRKRADNSDVENVPQGNPELLSKIIDIMDHDPEIYSADFSIDVLARLCDEKTKVVSAELNASLSKNFNMLLNEYRVREMCRLLNDPTNATLTIEAVAQRVGYKSRSTYIAAFKKHTGLTPSEYMKVRSSTVASHDNKSDIDVENAD